MAFLVNLGGGFAIGFEFLDSEPKCATKIKKKVAEYGAKVRGSRKNTNN